VGLSGVHSRERAKLAGVNEYLTKPVDIHRLIEVLIDHLSLTDTRPKTG
jgi:CheY-like chemotaxis protein